MSAFLGSATRGKRFFKFLNQLLGIIVGNRCLTNVGDFFRVLDLKIPDLSRFFNDIDFRVNLSEPSLLPLVAGMSDHDDAVALLMHLGDFHMNFGHERAGRIVNGQIPGSGFFFN